MFAPYKVVLTNPQSYLCGFVGGLLFMPTTVGIMIWGVPLLRALGAEPGEAVQRASSVAFGWVIGAPLLGYIADRIGRRKPVLLGGIVVIALPPVRRSTHDVVGVSNGRSDLGRRHRPGFHPDAVPA